MTDTKRIAVAGATGRLGRHVVDVLTEQGHEVVAFSRNSGVDIATGAGLVEALEGVQVVIDTTGIPTADKDAATEFFAATAHHLHEAGRKAGVERLVAVSIVGIDGSVDGYNAAKLAHEQALVAGPLPVRILRAGQFYELLEMLLQWTTRDNVSYMPKTRTQMVAVRTVAEALVALALDPADPPAGPFPEVAGPNVETLAGTAAQLAARLGGPAEVHEVSDPANPDRELLEDRGMLASPHALIAGPSFTEWLDAHYPAAN